MQVKNLNQLKKFLQLGNAKEFKFLSGNVVMLFCGKKLACTYFL